MKCLTWNLEWASPVSGRLKLMQKEINEVDPDVVCYTEVIRTVQHNLIAGALLVVLVLFVMLGDIRAGLIVAIVIPIAMLLAVVGMYHFAIAASLLSLGAIDFGIM